MRAKELFKKTTAGLLVFCMLAMAAPFSALAAGSLEQGYVAPADSTADLGLSNSSENKAAQGIADVRAANIPPANAYYFHEGAAPDAALLAQAEAQYGLTFDPANIINTTVVSYKDYVITGGALFAFEGASSYDIDFTGNANRAKLEEDNMVFAGITAGDTTGTAIRFVEGATPVHTILEGSNILFENLTINPNGDLGDASTGNDYCLTIMGDNFAMSNVVMTGSTGTGKHCALNFYHNTGVYLDNVEISNMEGSSVYLGTIQFNNSTNCYFNNLTIVETIKAYAIAVYAGSTDIEFSGTFDIGDRAIMSGVAADEVRVPTEQYRYAALTAAGLAYTEDYPAAAVALYRGASAQIAVLDTKTGYFVADQHSGAYDTALADIIALAAPMSLSAYNIKLLTGTGGELAALDTSANTETLILFPVDDADYDDFDANDKLYTATAANLLLGASSTLYNIDFSQMESGMSVADVIPAIGPGIDNFVHCKFSSDIAVSSLVATPVKLPYTGGSVSIAIEGSNFNEVTTAELKVIDADGNVLHTLPLDNSGASTSQTLPLNITTNNNTTADIKLQLKLYFDGMEYALATPVAITLEPKEAEIKEPDVPGDKIKNGWHLIGSDYYYFKNDVLQKGWLQLDGKWYLTDSSTGARKTGWQLVGAWWYYLDAAKGDAMHEGWLQDNGKWYYLKPVSGRMLTGWQKLEWKGKQDWYFFLPSGRMLTGWQRLVWQGQTDWYYLGGGGQMRTGWLPYKSKWYYLRESGRMHTAWLQLGSKIYYLHKTNGDMFVGTHNIGGESYTFGPSGALQ